MTQAFLPNLAPFFIATGWALPLADLCPWARSSSGAPLLRGGILRILTVQIANLAKVVGPAGDAGNPDPPLSITVATNWVSSTKKNVVAISVSKAGKLYRAIWLPGGTARHLGHPPGDGTDLRFQD